MTTTFFTKLEAAVERNQSLLCVGLDPNPTQLPTRYRQDNGDLFAGILAWNRAVIESTADLVCTYKPNIAFYEAMGAPGMELLRQTLALIPTDIPVLLDAKRGDIDSTAAAYARACFEDLGVDAVTLSPYLGRNSIDPFAAYADKGLFVLCHTSNPSAGEFQELEISDWRTLDRDPNRPLYQRVAQTAPTWSPNVGLVVGATYPQVMADIRALAPDRWFLVPGIGVQGGDLEGTMRAGLREDDRGLIINASRGVCLADEPRTAAQTLRDQINIHRDEAADMHVATVAVSTTGAAMATADDTKENPRLKALIIGLAELEAVKFGDFTLASGMQSPLYVDLRLLVSRPALLALAAEFYAEVLATLRYDRIAGVPYAALPIGTAVAIHANVPMIYPRKEAKAYGLGKDIEGTWHAGERVVIIEDLFTTAGSVIKTVDRLRGVGLVIEDALVLIDREQGGKANLADVGVTGYSVLTITEVMDVLVDAGLLQAAKRQEVLTFLRG